MFVLYDDVGKLTLKGLGSMKIDMVVDDSAAASDKRTTPHLHIHQVLLVAEGMLDLFHHQVAREGGPAPLRRRAEVCSPGQMGGEGVMGLLPTTGDDLDLVRFQMAAQPGYTHKLNIDQQRVRAAYPLPPLSSSV